MTSIEQNGRAERTSSAAPAATEGARPGLPAWIWILLGGAAIVIGLWALTRSTMGIRIPELTDAAFEAALARWDARGPTSYNLEVKIEGLRSGTVVVEVRQGEVIKMVRDGRLPEQRRTWDAWSVPGMFDMIEREMELAADPAGELDVARDTRWWLRCQFDAVDGHPIRFHRAVFGGGPEVSWQVVRFEAL